MGGGLLAAHGLESLKLSAMNTGGLNMYRPVIIAFGVPLIATETFLCLSESLLCHLQHTKSPHKISERK